MKTESRNTTATQKEQMVYSRTQYNIVERANLAKFLFAAKVSPGVALVNWTKRNLQDLIDLVKENFPQREIMSLHRFENSTLVAVKFAKGNNDLFSIFSLSENIESLCVDLLQEQTSKALCGFSFINKTVLN